MRKIVLFMHSSLDGFAAGAKGEMDWIKVDDDMFEYAGKQTDDADTALYGRITFQMMDSYWPTAGNSPDASKHDIQHSTWYNKVNKIVLSNSLKDTNHPNTKFISGNIQEQVLNLKNQPGKNILIFGSPSACHTLMQYNLIDEYWLFVNPILLGSGIPIFNKISSSVNLKLAESVTFKSGVIALHYCKI